MTPLRLSFFATIIGLSLSTPAAARFVSSSSSSEPMACTMEAKLCPDGETYVGRDSENGCAFRPCPGEASSSSVQACTKEAKVCPDGSTVGRTGPNCAFAACPSASSSANCSPYKCNDGTEVARCGPDGHVIYYFAPPCMTHGGDAGPFTDVPANHANANAIAYAKTEGIVEGYSDGTFKPDATINRAEFVKILMGTRDDDPKMCKIAPFPDIDQSAWYASDIHEARCDGLVGGYPDGTFKPANSINFAEVAKILAKAFGLEATTTVPACEDSNCPWYREFALMLEAHAAIPVSVGSLGDNITRGEMAEMVWRLREGINDLPSKTYERLAKAGSTYRVSYGFDRGAEGGAAAFDAQVIERRTDGTASIVVKSVKEAIPALKEKDNLTLKVFAQSADGTVIFKSIYMDTDDSSGDLYAFDIVSHAFTRMKVNEIYDGFYGGFALSADQTRFAWVPNKEMGGDTKTMYLIDLASDSYEAIVQLSGKETFNGGGFALSSSFNISWIDNETLRYSVYDQSKKSEQFYDPDDTVRIAVRTVKP